MCEEDWYVGLGQEGGISDSSLNLVCVKVEGAVWNTLKKDEKKRGEGKQRH